MKKIFTVAIVALCALMVFSCKNNGGKGQEATEGTAVEAEAAECSGCCGECKEGECQGTCEKCAKEGLEKIDAELGAAAEALDEAALAAKGIINASAVEVKPQFNGGDANDFQKWVQENVKYPQAAIDNGEAGRVMVNFIVGKDGKVSDVKVLKGVSEALDAEAVRVIESAPEWTPGAQAGNAVPVSYVMPVVFALK